MAFYFSPSKHHPLVPKVSESASGAVETAETSTGYLQRNNVNREETNVAASLSSGIRDNIVLNSDFYSSDISGSVRSINLQTRNTVSTSSYASLSMSGPLTTNESVRPPLVTGSSSQQAEQVTANTLADAANALQFEEWVVFSPEPSEQSYNSTDLRNEEDVNENSHETDQPSDGDNVKVEETLGNVYVGAKLTLKAGVRRPSSLLERSKEGNLTGTSTPLAFPGHNGSGSFLSNSVSSSMDVSDRINAWRLDQSQQVLKEFERLEMKRRRRLSSKSSFSRPESVLSSWGIPEEDISDDELSLGLGAVNQSKSLSSFGKLDKQLDHIMNLDRNINKIPTRSSSEELKQQKEESFWTSFTRRVIQGFIAIDEEVLDIIFGEKLVDTSQPTTNTNKPSSHRQSYYNGYRYNRDADLARFASNGWEKKLIDKITREVNRHSGYDFNSLNVLRFIGSRLFSPFTGSVPADDMNQEDEVVREIFHARTGSVSSKRRYSPSETSLKRMRKSNNNWDQERSATTSNYWEMSSVGGDGSMIGVW